MNEKNDYRFPLFVLNITSWLPFQDQLLMVGLCNVEGGTCEDPHSQKKKKNTCSVKSTPFYLVGFGPTRNGINQPKIIPNLGELGLGRLCLQLLTHGFPDHFGVGGGSVYLDVPFERLVLL